MTPRIDLEAIRARVKAATPGPWHEYDVSIYVLNESNRKFAAHARADIPALLGLVEEMAEALESIGRNTCGREPLAAAYARGVLKESGYADGAAARRKDGGP